MTVTPGLGSMRRVAMGVMLIVAGQTVIARANGETPVPDVDSINSGRAIYEQHCASCHGANAEGAPNWQERDARGELPAPPHNAEGHTWRHSDAALYEMVSRGWRDPFNKSKRLTMPAFGGEMSPRTDSRGDWLSQDTVDSRATPVSIGRDPRSSRAEPDALALDYRKDNRFL